MQKILIYSSDVWSLESVRASIDVNFDHPICTAIDEKTLRTELESSVFNLGIFRVKEIDQDTLRKISMMRSMGYKFPLLIAADNIGIKFSDLLKKLSDVHILSTPFRDVSLVGLARKILMGQQVPRQFFRRFYTNQIAELESLGSGDSHLSCMYNLSEGGAYCEFENKDGIGIGDLFRVKVDKENMNSQHILNAKVVWTTDKGKFSGRFGCGLRFISQKEVYQSLMAKL